MWWVTRSGTGNLFRAGARWDFPEQLVGRSDKRETPKMRLYILQYFYCKAGKSMRRLVLLAMEKYFNVRLDGWDRQQNNVIEMAVRKQEAKAILCKLHFEEELFATVGATKHGYDASNVRNVFRKTHRREGDVTKEGLWRRVVDLRLLFIIPL